MQDFSVRYQFPVVFTHDVFADDNNALLEAICHLEMDKQHRVLMFVDAAVAEADSTLTSRATRWFAERGPWLDLLAPPEIITGGEAIKHDWAALEPIRAAICDRELDRHACIVAIGGGALLDAVGLVAATAHRGIRLVRMPTTVLAQNDSGVGVKNAINQYGQKNYLGTFAPPWAVVNDGRFLDTLSERDRRAGMAEAVKVALIRGADFFTWLEIKADELRRFDRESVGYLVQRCAELHMHQIAHGGDPFENGSARPLDFGHWSAHRLETLSNHDIRHGEAVAIGIALDTRYSVLSGLLTEGQDLRVRRLLERLGFTLWHPLLQSRDSEGVPALLAGLEHFRAHLGGELTVTLLEGIGRGIEVHTIDSKLVMQAVDWLRIEEA